eukprot:3168604-Rhodomonas_salina.1
MSGSLTCTPRGPRQVRSTRVSTGQRRVILETTYGIASRTVGGQGGWYPAAHGHALCSPRLGQTLLVPGATLRERRRMRGNGE